MIGMKIRLSFDQKDILIKVIEYFNWFYKFDFTIHPTCVILDNIGEDEAIELRELCSEYLVKYGFDSNYNTNKEGKLLENLIDKLFIE